MTIITTTTIEMKMLILEDVHLKDIKMVICSQLLKLARPNQPFLKVSKGLSSKPSGDYIVVPIGNEKEK